jgi:hypothetical protein
MSEPISLICAFYIPPPPRTALARIRAFLHCIGVNERIKGLRTFRNVNEYIPELWSQIDIRQRMALATKLGILETSRAARGPDNTSQCSGDCHKSRDSGGLQTRPE